MRLELPLLLDECTLSNYDVGVVLRLVLGRIGAIAAVKTETSMERE